MTNDLPVNIRIKETDVYLKKYNIWKDYFRGTSKVLQYFDEKEGWKDIPKEYETLYVD